MSVAHQHSVIDSIIANVQCSPAEVHPLVLSPNSWIWNALRLLASLPRMFQEMFVGELSSNCSKVMVPKTVESPRTVATTRHNAVLVICTLELLCETSIHLLALTILTNENCLCDFPGDIFAKSAGTAFHTIC